MFGLIKSTSKISFLKKISKLKLEKYSVFKYLADYMRL